MALHVAVRDANSGGPGEPPGPLGLEIAKDSYPLPIEFAWLLMEVSYLRPPWLSGSYHPRSYPGCSHGTCAFVDDDATAKKRAKCRHDFFQIGTSIRSPLAPALALTFTLPARHDSSTRADGCPWIAFVDVLCWLNATPVAQPLRVRQEDRSRALPFRGSNTAKTSTGTCPPHDSQT